MGFYALLMEILAPLFWKHPVVLKKGNVWKVLGNVYCSEDIQVSQVEARIQIPNQYLSSLKYTPYN